MVDVGDNGDVADVLDGHGDTGIVQNLGAEYTPSNSNIHLFCQKATLGLETAE
jgi:hypothetical protein